MNSEIQKKVDAYPPQARKRFFEIRELILEAAKADDAGEITETLKWGEPAWLSPKGSTVRVDWKAKNPDRFSIYFNCNTILVETFRELYGDLFQFSGNREIVLPLSGKIPVAELKTCISMSLRYHNVKNLPLLGA